MEKIANKIIDINQPLQVLIQDVTIQNPKKYNVDYWKLPMYEIVTEHGNYIASGLFGDRFHWNEFVGQTLSIWSQESESPQWLWLRIKKNPIIISFDNILKDYTLFQKTEVIMSIKSNLQGKILIVM